MTLKVNNHKSSSPRGLVESNRNWNGVRTSGCPSSERSGSYLLSRDWGSAIKGAQNIGQSLPNRLILMIVLACQCSSSDFNVVIPEICNMTETSVNISWIHEMVLLGIREEQPQLSLNILGPQEICDGSNGLLKFISLAKEDKNGQMIASLEPHLCSTAATFRHLQGKTFVSWTCPKVPGVISIKPLTSDVILAINRLVKYLNWGKFAFAKSQLDKSSFCDEIGSQLQKEMETRPNNYSVLILGRYEDLQLSQYSSVMDSLQGLFLCISYTQGFTHNLAAKTELKYLSEQKELKDGRLPLVILPEWPLPLKLFSSSKDKSILALMSHPHPLNSPPPPPLDTDRKPSWESFAEFVPLESHDASTSPKKNIAEPLLARLILQSIKVSLEYEKMNGKNGGGKEREGLDQSENLISSSVHPLETGGESGGTSNNPNSVDEDGEKKSHKDNDGFKEHRIMSFQFLVFQFDKDRWHPVINFILGDNVAMKSSSGMKREESTVITQGSTEERNRDSLVSWLQIIGATVLTVTVVGSIIGLSLYARERYQNQLYMQANTSHKKSLVPRIRNQGPYKLILTSRDICFGTYPVSNNDSNKKISKSFDGELLCSAGSGTGTASSGGLLESHTAASQRFLRAPSLDDPGEKPDLLKGSIGTLKKRLSIADIKNNDSMIMYENQARYKGDLVHVRKLTEPSDSFEIKAKAMNVLETVHGLRHENLVALIGLLTDGIPSMVWEYCSRGSLHDVIKQQDIKLDWAFKLSLLTDLVRGMRYLHSSLVRVHGFLTSYNCVIDARWVLKVTDYGILSFHHTQGIPLTPRTPKELLWTAPELLRDENLRKHGTQPGDVYSFAIIMQELLVRGEPYFMLPLSAEDILEKVKRPPPLIRPSVSKGAAPPEAINIMRQCWAEIPDMRPDFMVIHDLFKTLNHGRKANIVDTMFQMLEKYSNNLEELIRERTEQLDLEKKKTEQLLNRMLPSTVAEKLKLGLPVDPEDFSEVTIYFSDIVGFTTISAYSTPFEVVDLLNDLYTCFDATINDYNVYKVETIGDAYMVVGGAPVRSPDHSDQIATMALDLLYESGKFRIRHLPYTPLRLRIGIHTGPCCAGVVGLTMPRYCLFGDTVNTASRMESTGAPWRIHISCNTKSKLESIGGYHIEYRGVTDIKGKGKMPTYWLLGKEGFNKELPVPPKESEIHGLDEKSILYGRTGVRQEGDGASVNLKPEIVAFRDSRSNSQEGCSGGSNTLHVDPSGKPLSAVGKVQGEALRCLSPAEEVAHQLLNGRPAVRGLRRQFSLDQGSNYYIPPVSRNRGAFRKTPSLEETSGDGHHHHYHNHNHHSSTSSLSIIPSASSGKGRLQHYSSVDDGKYHETSPTEANSSSSKSSSSFKHVTATKSNSIPSSGGDKSDNNELLPSNKSKITLSPRTGRIFIKSSSLTIVEESPTLE